MTAEAPPKSKRKWPRADALAVVRVMLPWLRPLCVRVVIAGSLRRGKAEVGDIEVLYIPRLIDVRDESDLFGRTKKASAVDVDLARRHAAGEFAKRLKCTGAISAWGPEMKHAVHESSGVPVDFFAAAADTWACNLVCRTGSAASNTTIAARALDRGWTWHPTGTGFERVSGPDRGRIAAMHSEEEIFQFVGLEYLQPEQRQ